MRRGLERSFDVSQCETVALETAETSPSLIMVCQPAPVCSPKRLDSSVATTSSDGKLPSTDERFVRLDNLLG
jgi:hypothetical protein